MRRTDFRLEINRPHRHPSSLFMSQPPATVIPATQGFKEWSLVCSALGSGDQAIILRKGGIHEGQRGFWWQHDRFYLFPTHFHEQHKAFSWAGAPSGGESAAETPAVHTLTLYAEVVCKAQLTSWDRVDALRPFHRWDDAAIKDRFDYTDHKGISMACLRVFRLSEPWSFPDAPKYGGCRSWLSLPEPPRSALLMEPVIASDTFESLVSRIRQASGI
jgi:hypothetical protein